MVQSCLEDTTDYDTWKKGKWRTRILPAFISHELFCEISSERLHWEWDEQQCSTLAEAGYSMLLV
jgi:hypothetical protein